MNRPARLLLPALLAAGLGLVAGGAAGVPALLWSRTYNSPGNAGDGVGRLAVDPSGYVSVGGNAPLSGAHDWVIRRWDPDGNLQGQATFAGPAGGIDEIYDIVADSAGNVIAAGSEAVAGMSYNWRVRKYDAALNLVWSATYALPGGSDDRAYGVAVDPAGHVIASGYTSNWLTVAKFDGATGALLWTRTGPNPSLSYDVTADAAGNVIVAGTVSGPGTWDFTLWKYAPDGTPLWSTVFNGSANGNDQAWGVAVDPADGALYASGHDNAKITLHKYSSAGTPDWSVNWASPLVSVAKTVVVSPTGIVVMVGMEDRSDLSQSNNWFVQARDPAGTLLWTITKTSTGNYSDYARGVGVDAIGHIFVAGMDSRYDLGEQENWLLWKLGPASALASALSLSGTSWTSGQTLTATLTVSNTGSSTCLAVAPGLAWTGAGAVSVVAGPTPSSQMLAAGAAQSFVWTLSCTGAGAVVLTVSASGTDADTRIRLSSVPGSATLQITAPPVTPPLAWTVSPTQAGSDVVFHGAVDSCNNRISSGWNVPGVAEFIVRKHSPAGALLWSYTAPDPAAAGAAGIGVAVAPDDSVYACGRMNSAAAGVNWHLIRLTSAGTLLWATLYNSPANLDDEPLAVAALPGGDVVAVGGTNRADLGHGFDWRVARYRAADGALLWATTYHSGIDAGGGDLVSGVTVDPAGNIVVAGHEQVASGGAAWRIVKYSPAGTVIWSRSYGGRPGNLDALPTDVAVNAAGDIHVSGYDLVNPWPDYDFLVTKFSGATGDLVWDRSYAGSAGATDEARSIALLPDGTVIAAGVAGESGQGTNGVARAYSSSGTFLWMFNYNGPIGGGDEYNGVAADHCGNFSLSGSHTTAAGGSDWLIQTYAFGPDCGCATIPVTPPVTPPPPVEPVNVGDVKIVGGVRGYINPKQGERATILLRPDTAGPVVARIYDRAGVLVREIIGMATGGRTIVLHWDATDAAGVTVPPGIYPVLITGPGIRYTDKLAVLR